MPGIVLLGSGAGAGAETRTDPGLKRARPQSAPQHITVNVYGCDNVVATDRSVLAVGGRSPVNANTGDVSASGTVGVDTDRSSLESGAATTGATGRPADNARSVRRPSHGGEASGHRATEPRESGRPSFPSPVSGQYHGTAVSGYEDHSVRVTGTDQKAVYDDSNLFVDRNGQLNANTGDTDSSGLNATDVSGSTVRSGDHTEGDESGDEPADQMEAAGARRAGGPAASTRTRPPPHEQAASTVTDEGESRASGDGTLTIGADGYDDLGVEVEGKRNVAAYDDSNVVTGGTGDVNAQVGDSDTSGAAVMGIDNSDVRSGNST